MLVANAVSALNAMVNGGQAQFGVVGLTNNKMLETALKNFKDTDSLTFLWLDCEGVDAPNAFWQMVKARTLAPVCHVVFTSAGANKPGLIRAWQEFTELYCGSVFGSMYLMRYTNLVKPKLVSSMKGIMNP